MGRPVTLGYWFERDDGTESYAELDVYVTEPSPGTYWDPPYRGDIEREGLWIDGEDVPMAEHEALVERILDTQRIPEPDYAE